MTNPRVTDNDKGEISVALDGKQLRSWIYVGQDARRMKMGFAREYVEGWCDARDCHSPQATSDVSTPSEGRE